MTPEALKRLSLICADLYERAVLEPYLGPDGVETRAPDPPIHAGDVQSAMQFARYLALNVTKDEPRAPVQREGGCYTRHLHPIKLQQLAETGRPGLVPGTVAWSEHERAWQTYKLAGHGSQSAERLAERGGFGYVELVDLLGYAPLTWMPR